MVACFVADGVKLKNYTIPPVAARDPVCIDETAGAREDSFIGGLHARC
jgi:hypothetical protein